ncbi:MAG TPA: nuclear transport factor 2 family protein [Longimicrobiaceae bacterium]|nr:nuclear transport factor 2 family protein [Longimicrobiaceae bacterium]
MKPIPIALLLLTAACQGVQPLGGMGPGTAPPASSAAARVVDAQVEAYNRHDLAAFLATYAPDAALWVHPDDRVAQGTEQLRTRYREQWRENPRLRVEVEQRMVQGNYVIDHEHSVGWADGQDVRVVAIYEVRGGRIRNVWFIR